LPRTSPFMPIILFVKKLLISIKNIKVNEITITLFNIGNKINKEGDWIFKNPLYIINILLFINSKIN